MYIQVAQSCTQKLKGHQVRTSYNTADFLRFLNLHWYKSTAPIPSTTTPTITMTPPTIPVKVAISSLLSDSEAVVMHTFIVSSSLNNNILDEIEVPTDTTVVTKL